jgi:hypothetical protein
MVVKASGCGTSTITVPNWSRVGVATVVVLSVDPAYVLVMVVNCVAEGTSTITVPGCLKVGAAIVAVPVVVPE